MKRGPALPRSSVTYGVVTRGGTLPFKLVTKEPDRVRLLSSIT